MSDIDWELLRYKAIEAATHAYAPILEVPGGGPQRWSTTVEWSPVAMWKKMSHMA